MTKLTYEIYDVRTGEKVMEFTDYDAMKKTLAETREIWKEDGHGYCPLSYKQKYTPEHISVGEKNYIQFYKDKFAKA